MKDEDRCKILVVVAYRYVFKPLEKNSRLTVNNSPIRQSYLLHKAPRLQLQATVL